MYIYTCVYVYVYTYICMCTCVLYLFILCWYSVVHLTSLLSILACLLFVENVDNGDEVRAPRYFFPFII